MAIYEYECPVCGRFEVEQKMMDEQLKYCPECEKKLQYVPVTKIISASSFQLKGTGFYKTDYKKS